MTIVHVQKTWLCHGICPKYAMTTVQKPWYDHSTVDVDFQKTWYNHDKCP